MGMGKGDPDFGVFMAQLDNGIISSALTTINRHFDVSENWGAWGITIYTLGLAMSEFLDRLVVRRNTLKQQLDAPEFQEIRLMIQGELKARELWIQCLKKTKNESIS